MQKCDMYIHVLCLIVVPFRNPYYPDVENLWRYRNYAGSVERKKRCHESSATVNAEHSMSEDEAMDTM